jgi:hypothetical protein
MYLSDFCRFLPCTYGWERRGIGGAGEGRGARLFWAQMAQKVSIFRAPPLKCPLLWIVPPQNHFVPPHINNRYIKGIDRPFGGRVKSRLIRSLLINWRLGNFFSSYFK